jgi:hypothetical protein
MALLDASTEATGAERIVEDLLAAQRQIAYPAGEERSLVK